MSILYDALQILAAQDPDRAEELNGIGFNSYDGTMGHDLASLPESVWTPAQTYKVWNLLRKYKGQLARAGIDYDTIPIPPKANGEGKGSMEVRSGEVLVIFPYDAMLKDDLKAQLPWPTLSFTKFPIPAWLVKSEPDAVRKIAQWAEAHGFTVSLDVWAIANSEPKAAGQANGEAKAPESVKAKVPGPDPHPANPRRLDWDGAQFVMSFPYSADLVEASKEVPGRSYDKVNRRNLYPAQADSVKALIAFTAKYDFHCTERAKAACQTVLENHVQAVEASKATNADVIIPGLADGLALLPFQKAGVVYMHQKERCFNNDGVGLGKTIQAIAVTQLADAYPVLVFCPVTVKENWRREWVKWVPGKIVTMVSGRNNHVPQGADVYLCNYEILADGYTTELVADKRSGMMKEAKTIKLTETGKSLLAINAKSVILDESHRCKSMTAQRTQAMVALAEGKQYRWLLTATPFKNRPVEGESQLAIMGQLGPVFGGGWKYKQKYCDPQHNGFGWDFSGASNLDELHEKLQANCMVRRLKSQVMSELPPIQRTPVYLDLDNRREYDAAEQDVSAAAAKLAAEDKRFRASIAGLPKEEQVEAISRHAQDAAYKAMLAETLVRINVLRRLAAKGKMAAIKDWLSDFLEGGEKVLVFGWHRDMVEGLAEALDAPYIEGGMANKQRQAVVDGFQSGKGQVVVMNMLAAGEGLTLTQATHCAFVELPWNLPTIEQAEGRCYGRINDPHGINTWLLVAKDTIDEYMWDVIKDKKAVTDRATDGIIQEEPGEGIVEAVVRRIANKGKGLTDGD